MRSFVCGLIALAFFIALGAVVRRPLAASLPQ
jgi:hypothetical protein